MRKKPSVLNDYINFVDTVTSPASKELIDFKDALDIIDEQGIEPSRLLTASYRICLVRSVSLMISSRS